MKYNIIGTNKVCIFQDEEIISMEYLEEFKENIPELNNYKNANIEDCNISISQRREFVDNRHQKSEAVPIRKLNLNDHVNVGQCTTELNEVPNDENRNIGQSPIQRSGNEAAKEFKKQSRKTMTTATQRLKNSITVSTHLNNIYEKTCELKKEYYAIRLEYLRRSTEANEKIANITEKWDIFGH